MNIFNNYIIEITIHNSGNRISFLLNNKNAQKQHCDNYYRDIFLKIYEINK